MSEDISAMIRLGATVVMLSALVMAIVIVVNVTLPLFYDWIGTAQEALQVKSELVFSEISEQSSISGAEVYKLYALNAEYFYAVCITDLSGTVSYDGNILKMRASRRYKVNVTYNADGNHSNQYYLEVKEVDY